jgi:transposase-like protein
LVAAEKRADRTGRVRLAVAPDFTQATMLHFVRADVAPGSTVYTDGLKGWEGLQAAGVRHVPRTHPFRTVLRRGVPSVVPLADRALGNLQQWLIGTYHGVSRHHLQVYLDEFAFRHNRRKTLMAASQTLLGLGSARGPTPGRVIRRARDLPQSPIRT